MERERRWWNLEVRVSSVTTRRQSSQKESKESGWRRVGRGKESELWRGKERAGRIKKIKKLFGQHSPLVFFDDHSYNKSK